jgi:hypothetical protein
VPQIVARDMAKIQRALLSVSDKTGLVAICAGVGGGG